MAGDKDIQSDQTVSFKAPPGWHAGAAREAVHVLLLLVDGAPPKRVPLHELPVVIGRHASSGLVLEGNTVSRRHCRLSLEGTDLCITDLSSTNGTFVNDRRLEAPATLVDGDVIGIGAWRLRYHRRGRDEAAEAEALDTELREASAYVASVLPKPLHAGPVRATWFHQPSTRIGGDAFGYQMLDSASFAFFLLDVSGHGTGAGMHAMAVAQLLRERVLPDVAFHDPAAVIAALNQRFPMDRNADLFFTIWYGVYEIPTRQLTFSAGGHHPAFLVRNGASAAEPLDVVNPVVGMMPDVVFTAGRTVVPPDAALILFSDGVFEFTGRDGRDHQLDDLVPLLPGVVTRDDPAELYHLMKRGADPARPDDDVSILLLRFP